jgi:hypothetical protein
MVCSFHFLLASLAAATNGFDSLRMCGAIKKARFKNEIYGQLLCHSLARAIE